MTSRRIPVLVFYGALCLLIGVVSVSGLTTLTTALRTQSTTAANNRFFDTLTRASQPECPEASPNLCRVRLLRLDPDVLTAVVPEATGSSHLIQLQAVPNSRLTQREMSARALLDPVLSVRETDLDPTTAITRDSTAQLHLTYWDAAGVRLDPGVPARAQNPPAWVTVLLTTSTSERTLTLAVTS